MSKATWIIAPTLTSAPHRRYVIKKWSLDKPAFTTNTSCFILTSSGIYTKKFGIDPENNNKAFKYLFTEVFPILILDC